MSAGVRFLSRGEVDFAAWDDAVRRQPTSAPYGLSWWLDAVTNNHWFGAVLGDYRAVLPVTLSPALLRRTVRLINGAAFTQHAGPFGEYSLTEAGLLLNAVPAHWLLRKLAVYLPTQPITMRKLSAKVRTNHELDLNAPYRSLAKGYRADLRRKLRGVAPAALQPMGIDPFLSFYRKNTGNRFGMQDDEYATQARLLSANKQFGQGEIYQLTDGEGDTTAAIFIARHGNRLVNLMASSNAEGFRTHAMARLLDAVIRAHAGRPMVLDFEGSDIKGVATFFRGFGAAPVSYLSLADQSLVARILP